MKLEEEVKQTSSPEDYAKWKKLRDEQNSTPLGRWGNFVNEHPFLAMVVVLIVVAIISFLTTGNWDWTQNSSNDTPGGFEQTVDPSPAR